MAMSATSPIPDEKSDRICSFLLGLVVGELPVGRGGFLASSLRGHGCDSLGGQVQLHVEAIGVPILTRTSGNPVAG